MKTNKKPLIALAVLAMVGIVAGTIAYFTSTAEFPNVFRTKTYNTELTEEFKSPEDWTPGTTTKKLVEIKNTGNIPLVARVSYTELWEPIEGAPLSNTLEDGTPVVSLNGIDGTKWTLREETLEDGTKKNYYYYNDIIAPAEEGKAPEAVKFMDSVTFNENVNIDYDETTVETYATTEDESDAVTVTITKDDEENTIYVFKSKDGSVIATETVAKNAELTTEQKAPISGKKLIKQTKKYESKKDGYAGATYTLTIKIETVQADKYKEAWKTTIEIPKK